MKPDISIIIPCYQSEHTIVATLDSVFAQKTKTSFEVIVVNSSPDGTRDLVSKYYPDVLLLQQAVRTRAAVARNIGAGRARAAVLAFLDSDCVVDSDWLQTAFERFSERFCGLGGPIENANPDSAVSWAGYVLEFSDFFASPEARPVAHIPSGNLFVKKTVFDSVGGFPEQFDFAQEDRYFSWLVTKQTGQMFLFDPDIRVRHHQRLHWLEFLNHQRAIGEGGAEILRRTDLTGHQLIRNKLLMLLILPLLPGKKFFFCCVRLLRFKPQLVVQYPALLPLMFAGMLYWGMGFAQSVVLSE